MAGRTITILRFVPCPCAGPVVMHFYSALFILRCYSALLFCARTLLAGSSFCRGRLLAGRAGHHTVDAGRLCGQSGATAGLAFKLASRGRSKRALHWTQRGRYGTSRTTDPGPFFISKSFSQPIRRLAHNDGGRNAFAAETPTGSAGWKRRPGAPTGSVDWKCRKGRNERPSKGNRKAIERQSKGD